MIGYVEAPRAWWLTHGMARAAGVNLPGAVVDGFVTRRELAELVHRCQTCGCSAQCTQWLGSARWPAALPGYCPNKAELESLVPRPAG